MIRLALVVITLAAFALPLPLNAQGTETYTARLGWVPTTPTDRPNVTGKGSAPPHSRDANSRSLARSRAWPHRPPSRGFIAASPGRARRCDRRSHGDAGRQRQALWCRPNLTAEQVEALKQGKLYIQLHTAKGVAPDGSTLWGGCSIGFGLRTVALVPSGFGRARGLTHDSQEPFSAGRVRHTRGVWRSPLRSAAGRRAVHR
jgi:hypothetical protein